MTCPICFGEDEHGYFMGQPCPRAQVVITKDDAPKLIGVEPRPIEQWLKSRALREIEELEKLWRLNA
jgi:hypothetical protein